MRRCVRKPRGAGGVAPGEPERIVLERGVNGVRTAVIRPGVVYGRSRGIVGDLLKDALNGLVRVVGGRP